MNSFKIFNKGFEYKDLKDIFRSEVYKNLLEFIKEMTLKRLATTNRGTLRATNLNDTSGRHLRHTLNYIRAWEYVRLISIPELQIKKNAKILCLGEGSTPLMFFLAKLCHEITVVDLEKTLIDNTKEVAKNLNLLITAKVGDMTKIEFEDNFFDYIVSCSVIEHLTDKHKIESLFEMGRVLNPIGMICLSFDYGRYSGKALTGESHQTIPFEKFEDLIIRPSKCFPLGKLNRESTKPWVLKKPFWKFLSYYPGKCNILKKLFYKELPYSYYTLFLKKPPE